MITCDTVVAENTFFVTVNEAMNAHPQGRPGGEIHVTSFPGLLSGKAMSSRRPVAPPQESIRSLGDPAALFPDAPDCLRLALTRRWWIWPLVSASFHGLILALALLGGMFAVSQVETPLAVMGEISLDGLAGPGGDGGDGRESGGSPAVVSEPLSGPSGDLAQMAPNEPVAPEKALVEPEPEPPVQESTPVLDTSLPEPEKIVPPEPKPEPKPKPKPKPKPVAARPAAPDHSVDQAREHTPVVATGEGTGLGIGGEGPGKGLGHGEGAPGIGGGPGGGGGGSAVGQFGKGDGPRFRHRSTPRYPDGAKRANTEGRVCLCLSIDAEGILRDVNVVSHTGLEFVEEALRAIRASTFFPATFKGQPISSRAMLTIHFKLG